ncbi:hypothetical protein Taro_052625 [Colocasia esculenta]|uniref:Uncharacterized protein n=1 Tax=Colocasia esculenta TaxID=4460 RepID=A0A843XKS6_COLES|nr:hypothetical protein [Colocasia esculenta]
MNLMENGLDVDSLAVRVDGKGCRCLLVAPVEIGWLSGARGKTLVREAELDRAENSGSGGDSREKASKGSARIEVWQDFLHASEVSSQQAVLSLLP